MNKIAAQSEIECTCDGKTVILPLEDGTMYSKRKGIVPSSRPFSTATVEDYIPIVGEYKIDRLLKAAAKIQGAHILELNSTAIGGGVAEMLLSGVPLANKLGIDSEWLVIKGTNDFYEVTKGIHNLLQGKGGVFTSEMERIYFKTLDDNREAHIIDSDPDVVLVHDPQPLGLSPSLHEKGTRTAKWIWRCHIDMDEDTLKANPALEHFLNYLVEHYDAAIFSAAHYIICRWPFPKFIIPPVIDPLSDKNRDLSEKEINEVLEKHEIDPKIPIISQIGRFDPWKGITNTIDTYKLVKEEVNCQLVLAGGYAADDPEGEAIFNEICEKVKNDPEVHVLNLPPTSSLEINALQRASKVIMQPSIKEGFGLTVTEAMWKAKPVIASPVGGITLQLRDGDYGYFFNDAKDSAAKIIHLLTHQRAAEIMGLRGSDYVREHFMLPDRLADFLKIIMIMKQTKPDPDSIISFHSWHKLDKRK